MKHINGLIFVLAMIVAVAIAAHCQDQDELLKHPLYCLPLHNCTVIRSMRLMIKLSGVA